MYSHVMSDCCFNCINCVCPTVKHSLKIFFMLSSGVPNTPDYVAAGELGGILIAYYDSNMKTLEPRQDWIRESMEDDPRQWETLIKNCKHYKQLLTDEIRSFKQYSNQTGGMFLTFFLFVILLFVYLK